MQHLGIPADADRAIVVVAGVLALVGVLLVAWAMRTAVGQWNAARSWYEVRGEVAGGRAVAYEYPPGTRRILRTDAATTITRRNPGAPLRVQVNPVDPEEAMLVAGWHGDRSGAVRVGALGILCLFVGVVLLTVQLVV